MGDERKILEHSTPDFRDNQGKRADDLDSGQHKISKSFRRMMEFFAG